MQLGLRVVAQEVADDKPIPHNNMGTRSKLVAETGPTKQKIILGWFINFSQMTIALPENKFLPYLKKIPKCYNGWISHRKLETNIK
jgi:hypothetical protein